MADHYGDAELVVGQHHVDEKADGKMGLTAFTKWCPPENGDRSFKRAEEAVDLALRRMGQDSIALLQCIFPFFLLPPALNLVSLQIPTPYFTWNRKVQTNTKD